MQIKPATISRHAYGIYPPIAMLAGLQLDVSDFGNHANAISRSYETEKPCCVSPCASSHYRPRHPKSGMLRKRPFRV
jgi:hypothetical protein